MTIAVIPAGHTARPRIVVGLDLREGAVATLLWALEAAHHYAGQVHVVTVRSHRGGRSPRRWAEHAQSVAIARALAAYEGPRPQVTSVVVEGEAASHLIAAAAGASLLVLGSDPPEASGAERADDLGTTGGAPLGRLTDTCLRYADCPVVVVPASATATEH